MNVSLITTNKLVATIQVNELTNTHDVMQLALKKAGRAAETAST